MQPQYQTIEDKWGHLKAVMIPFKDNHGRPFLFGASVKIDEVDIILRNELLKMILLSCIILDAVPNFGQN
jgi:hypothetical protein